MTRTVAVIDYGMGNLDSVARAVDECGGRPVLAERPKELASAAAVILPGVGAFAKGMENIRARGFDEALERDVVAAGVPLLGLCLGMQLLASHGDEGSGAHGLGLVPGTVVRIDPVDGLRVPHVGWNEVHLDRASRLFEGIESGRDFYFVHSYHFVVEDTADVVGWTEYGARIAAAVQRGNVYGVQFHPEKSQRAGFALLRNFLALSSAGEPRGDQVALSAPPRF
jgi:glutamine amidotransferase